MVNVKNKIYVGNLSYQTSDEDMRSMFSNFGVVTEARVVSDRETGRSKGFGFVTFENSDAANAAVFEADQTEFMGRTLKVSIAEDRKPADRQQRPRRDNYDRGGRNDYRY